MANISGKLYIKLKEGKGPVTVISDGTKFSFDSVEEAKKFWRDCYYGSEGSEQNGYAEILMQLYDGATNISDGTDDLVPSGSKLFGEYNDVKKTNKYKIFGGYKDPDNDDYTPVYDEYTIGGENDHHKTAEDWILFFRGHDLARNKEAWKEFSNEMSNAGYSKELKDLKTRIENGYSVKLESVKPNVELSQDRLKTLLYNTVGALLCGDYAGVTTEEVADYLGSSVEELEAIYNSNDRLAVLVDNAISALQGGSFEGGASKEEIARYLGCSVKELKDYGALTESSSFKESNKKPKGRIKSEANDEIRKVNKKFEKEHPIDDEGFPLKTWYEDKGDNSFVIHLSKEDYDSFHEDDDLYCDCGSETDPEYVTNYMGVNHGWVCPECGKFRQIG